MKHRQFLWPFALCGVLNAIPSTASVALNPNKDSSTMNPPVSATSSGSGSGVRTKTGVEPTLKEVGQGQKNLIQAIIRSLPESCKEEIELCTFSFDKIESYQCVFKEPVSGSGSDSKKYVKTLTKILVYLKQLEKADLVDGFVKMWVKAREWGPTKQNVIKSDLINVLSVKGKEKEKEKENGVKIEATDLMECFEVLIRSGEELLIVPSPDWYDVAMEAIEMKNLTTAVDLKNDSEFMKLIVHTFFYIRSGSGEKEIQALKQSLSTAVLGKVEKDLRKGKLAKAIWERYGTLLQNELNDKCGTLLEVEMSAGESNDKEKKKKVSKSSKNDDPSESSLSSSSSSESVPSNKSKSKPESLKTKSSKKSKKNEKVVKMESNTNFNNTKINNQVRQPSIKSSSSNIKTLNEEWYHYSQYRNFGFAVGAGVLVAIVWAALFFLLRKKKGSDANKHSLTDL